MTVLPGGGGVLPRGTAVPTAVLPAAGREYAGTPVPPLAALVVGSPALTRRPRSTLGVAFTLPAPFDPAALADPALFVVVRGVAVPAWPPAFAARPSRGIAVP